MSQDRPKSVFEEWVPPKIRNTLLLKFFSFTQVPLLFFLRPSVEELTEERCVVKIPLTRRSKNHLNSLYFGALAAGADVSAGYLALVCMREQRKRYHFAFKDFKASFLKRAEDDTFFTCEEGHKIAQKVEEARRTGERVNFPVQVTATVPSLLGSEPVATFELTMSIKAK